MFKAIFGFIGSIVKAAIRTIGRVIISTVTNIEAVVILSLASIGTAAILAELPFIIAMPMWIESALVIPVLATSFVMLLAFIMERRLSCCEA